MVWLRTHYPQRAQVQANFVEECVSCRRVVIPTVAVLSSAAVIWAFKRVQQPEEIKEEIWTFLRALHKRYTAHGCHHRCIVHTCAHRPPSSCLSDRCARSHTPLGTQCAYRHSKSEAKHINTADEILRCCLEMCKEAVVAEQTYLQDPGFDSKIELPVYLDPLSHLDFSAGSEQLAWKMKRCDSLSSTALLLILGSIL